MTDPRKRLVVINVFSVKGGVGKTTLALLCGSHLANAKKVPTWVVDLDLAGTNLAEALGPAARAPRHGGRKLLHDFLALPPTASDADRRKVAGEIERKDKDWGSVRIVPSAASGEARSVLDPLLSAENWTGYLRDRIVGLVAIYARSTKRRAGKKMTAADRVAVVLDHGPGLQDLPLEFVEPKGLFADELRQELGAGWEVEVRHLLVSSGDTSDLWAAVRFLDEHVAAVEDPARVDDEKARFFVVFNRLGRGVSGYASADTDCARMIGRIFREDHWLMGSPRHERLLSTERLCLFDARERTATVGGLPDVVAGIGQDLLGEDVQRDVPLRGLLGWIETAAGLTP